MSGAVVPTGNADDTSHGVTDRNRFEVTRKGSFGAKSVDPCEDPAVVFFTSFRAITEGKL